MRLNLTNKFTLKYISVNYFLLFTFRYIPFGGSTGIKPDGMHMKLSERQNSLEKFDVLT